MKKIYVTTLYKLPISGCVKEHNVYELYKKAFEISLKRVHKFNNDFFDEYVVLVNNNNAMDNGEMDYHIIDKLYTLWKRGNVDILYSEVDTLCHGSLRELSNLTKFTMFAKGSAPDKEEYNSGVMYFPSTMDQAVWDIIMNHHKDWKPYWAYFQKIFDTAFKSQGPVSEDRRYNAFVSTSNPIITHHFSSRGIKNLLSVYKHYESDDPLPPFTEF